MKNNLNKNSRKSIRLKGYNYHNNGAYFITICTQNREHFWGEIIDEKMILNHAGEMIQKWLYKLNDNFEGVLLDGMVIMPNHIHFIVSIDISIEEKSLGKIIQWFKSMTTNEYIRGVKSNIFPAFNKRIWQRNYYEHIIRNEKSFFEIQEYMENNPKKWEEDILCQCYGLIISFFFFNPITRQFLS